MRAKESQIGQYPDCREEKPDEEPGEQPQQEEEE
jgi:hypothetical protein